MTLTQSANAKQVDMKAAWKYAENLFRKTLISISLTIHNDVLMKIRGKTLRKKGIKKQTHNLRDVHTLVYMMKNTPKK